MLRGSTKPFDVPMRHRFKNEKRRGAHDCQKKQDEQRIDDTVSSRAQFDLNLCPLAQLSSRISRALGRGMSSRFPCPNTYADSRRPAG